MPAVRHRPRFLSRAASLPGSGGPTLPDFLSTAQDVIPVFGKAVTVQSRQSGNWSDTVTWNHALPLSTDNVYVTPGVTVTIIDQTAVAKNVTVLGTLNFSPSADTRLTVETLTIFPQGILNMGTLAVPIPDGTTCEIVISDSTINVGLVGDSYGTGTVYDTTASQTWTG